MKLQDYQMVSSHFQEWWEVTQLENTEVNMQDISFVVTQHLLGECLFKKDFSPHIICASGSLKNSGTTEELVKG